jgi:hypothetical protein
MTSATMLPALCLGLLLLLGHGDAAANRSLFNPAANRSFFNPADLVYPVRAEINDMRREFDEADAQNGEAENMKHVEDQLSQAFAGKGLVQGALKLEPVTPVNMTVQERWMLAEEGRREPWTGQDVEDRCGRNPRLHEVAKTRPKQFEKRGAAAQS